MKKLLVVFLATCLLVSPIASQADQSTSQYNAVLALSALRYSVCIDLLASQKTVFEMDQSGDGVINALDALYILQIGVEKREPINKSEYKPEIYACIDEGVDPTGCAATVFQSVEDLEQYLYRLEGNEKPLPEPEYFEDHTMVVVALTAEIPKGYVPSLVTHSGTGLLVQLQWQETVSTNDGRLYLLEIPKVQANLATFCFQNIPDSPEAFVTTTDSLYQHWVNNGMEPIPAIPATLITNAKELKAYAEAEDEQLVKEFTGYSPQEAIAHLRKDKLPLEVQLTQGFYDQYRTVAIRYTCQGTPDFQVESVSSDGLITLKRVGGKGGNGLPSGAISSQMIFINLPVTKPMPDDYKVQIH